MRLQLTDETNSFPSTDRLCQLVEVMLWMFDVCRFLGGISSMFKSHK